MSVPWPPPPDLESIRQLVREADVEGLIAIHGAPADEYDTEADALHAVIADLPSDAINVSNLVPILNVIWRKNFVEEDAELASRRPALTALAAQIACFFGPEAKPQVR